MKLIGAIHEAAKTLAAIFATWCAVSLLGLAFHCTPGMPTLALAAIGGLSFRAAAIAYRHERANLSRRAGIAVLSLRLASIAVVLFMLLQPVLLRDTEREIVRTVAVLLDTSDSMRFNDESWTPSEAISLARGLKLKTKVAHPLPSLPQFSESAGELLPWLSTSTPDGSALPATRRMAKQTLADARKLEKELSRPPLSDSTNLVISSFAKSLRERVIGPLAEIDSAEARETIAEAIVSLAERRGELAAVADGVAWEALTSEDVAAITNAICTNRLSLAANVMSQSLGRLDRDYSVRLFSLGRHARPSSLEAMLADGDPGQSSASDFAISLEEAMDAVPSEELAGIILLTDGISNGETPVEPVAHRLASRGVKVSSVIVGSATPPRDLAIADISAPESVFLGDKVRIRSRLAATGLAGETAHISLLLEGETVDETTIPVSGDDFSRDFSLAYAVTNSGLARFTLAIDGVEGERFPSNNTWNVDVAVSDDRINVLLVDDYPRWDFRYLRNLFYARDKSIHLQYLLLHPDTIDELDTTNRPPAASASRPFGEAEAGDLPSCEDEWRKFDAIILGDVGPGVITGELQRVIRDCVADRGALLVTIAGPRAMPHAYPDDSILRSMLPADYPSFNPAADYWKGPEESFSLELTPSGRLHPVAQQSASAAENEQIWGSIPDGTWRIPTVGVKAGAEIVMFARGKDDDDAGAAGAAITAGNAIDLIEAERKRLVSHALAVTHNLGKGKVLSLNTDQSWRLRYRVGDTRHHRFWGQVMRWGLGERLRTGTERLRIGTERLTYTQHEPVRLLARIHDRDGNPVNNAAPTAIVTPGDGVATNAAISVPLAPVANSQGLYEATLPPMSETGAYTYTIMDCDRYLDPGDSPGMVSALFFVAASRRPIEMASVAATAETLESLARRTGGKVVRPGEAASLEGSFGEKSQTVREVLEIPLWDNKWLLSLLFALLLAEWAIRKKGGLV